MERLKYNVNETSQGGRRTCYEKLMNFRMGQGQVATSRTRASIIIYFNHLTGDYELVKMTIFRKARPGALKTYNRWC